MSTDCVIETVVSAPFDEVTYIAWKRGSKAALVVDPGFDSRSIFSLLEQHGLTLAAILNTHGHADHIAGNAAMKEAFPDAPLLIGKNEAHLLTDPDANLSRPFGLAIKSPPADRLLAEDDQFEAAGFHFEVREIPGHSPGSIIFLCQDQKPAFVFGGDVLFAGSVGRFDFPGGSGEALFSGIRSKLFTLPDDTTILPGHGPATTVGAEKRMNPFVGERAEAYKLD